MPKNSNSIPSQIKRSNRQPPKNRVYYISLKSHDFPRRNKIVVLKVKLEHMRHIFRKPIRTNSHNKRPTRLVPSTHTLKQRPRVGGPHSHSGTRSDSSSQPTKGEQASRRNISAERQSHSQLSLSSSNRIALTNLVDLKTR